MKKLLGNIFTILNRAERQKLWMLAVADVVISILDILFLLGLLYMVNFYTQGSGNGFINQHFPFLLQLHPLLPVVIFFLLFALKNLAAFIVTGAQYRFVYDVASALSANSLSQYLDSSYMEFVNIDSSVVFRKINQAPIEFCHYVLNGVQQIFNQAVLIVITTLFVVWLNPVIFSLLLLVLVPPVVAVVVFMKRRLSSSRLHEKAAGEKSIQHLQEALAGYIESNVTGKNDFFIKRYHRFQKRLNDYLSERLRLQNMPSRLIEVFVVFGFLVLVAIHFLVAGIQPVRLITIGTLMVAAYKIIPGIVKIMNLATQVKTYAFTAEDLAAATTKPSIKRGENREPITAIGFESISFNYTGKNILSSFSMDMSAGDFVCLTGSSGKGKTTLINLLLGFLSPLKGSIWFNNKNTDANGRQAYWNRIAYIKQQSFFLHASVAENITLQEQDYDKQKLDQVMQLTEIDKLKDAFPLGAESIITESGKNISGGQRQRIALARALYRDFDLLILDEPFNELDETAETGLLDLLQALALKNKMILLVTHNPAALAYCNKKISIDD